jgi:hypothetical protein
MAENELIQGDASSPESMPSTPAPTAEEGIGMVTQQEMEGKKKTFLLRLPPATMAALEQWAQEEFRSTHGQIEYLLSQSLKKRGLKG